VDANAAWLETCSMLCETYGSVPRSSTDLIIKYFESARGSKEEEALYEILDATDLGLVGFFNAVHGAYELLSRIEGSHLTQPAREDERSAGDAFDELLAAFSSTPPTARQLQRAHAETELALLTRLNALVGQCSDANELAKLVRIYNDIPPVDMDEYEPGEPPQWEMPGGQEPT
jgi:hypothetical protein